MNFDIHELLMNGQVPTDDQILPADFRTKFKLGKVYQLGLSVPSVENAAKELEARGLGPFLIADDDLALWIERGENRSFHGKLGIAFLGGYELELLEEGRGSTMYSAAFRPDGKIALHHVAYLDNKLEPRIKQFNDAGYETGVRAQIKLGPMTIDVAYMDCRREFGIYVEFIDYRFFGIASSPKQAMLKLVAKAFRVLGIKAVHMGKK